MLWYAGGGVEGHHRVTSLTGLTSDWTIHWGWPVLGEEGLRGFWWMAYKTRNCLWLKVIFFQIEQISMKYSGKKRARTIFPPRHQFNMLSLQLQSRWKERPEEDLTEKKAKRREAKVKQGTGSHLMQQDKPKQIPPCGTQSDLLHLGSSLKSAFSPSMALTTSVINTETWRSVTVPEFKGGGAVKKTLSTAVDWGSLVSPILTVTAGKDKRWRPNWATRINV